MNEIIRLTLMPGVRLSYLQTDKFKTAYLSLNLLRALREDEASLNALLPSVLLRGTDRYPDMQTICAQLDTLYGAGMEAIARKKGEVQTIGFYLDFLDDALSPDGSPILRPCVDFLCEVLMHPLLVDGAFRADYVEGEKANLLNDIESLINDKRTWATKRLVDVMFEGEAYAISRFGEKERVAAITPQALTDHWRSILSTSEVELFYLGRSPLEQVVDCLRTALQELPRGEFVPYGTERSIPERPMREVCEEMDVTQGKLVMGFRTPDTLDLAHLAALQMMNCIFGGGVSSKLFLHVREQRSLCYYASSGLEQHKGVLMVSAGIDSADYDVARDAILQELDACRRGEITPDELENARRSIVSSLRALEDSPGRIEDRSLNQRLLGVDRSVEDMIAQTMRVTLEEIQAAANRVRLDTIYFLKGADPNAQS